MLKEFRDFVLRGNVVELAVAVVIGAAFGAVVTAFVVSFVTPLMARRRPEPGVGETTRTCAECLSEIPAGARRCAFCTVEVAPA